MKLPVSLVIALLTAAPGLAVQAASPSAMGFLRGDPNLDGQVNIADSIFTLSYLFQGTGCNCLAAADVDGNGKLEITDPIALLTFSFLGGPAPPPPFPECEAVGGPPALGCAEPRCPMPAAEDAVWVWRADGCMQCASCPGVEEIVADLEAAGISVEDSRHGGVPGISVCLACLVCPSGRAYHVLVSSADALTLEERGWRRVE